MTRMGRLAGVVVAACGFVVAQVVVQAGNAMELQQVPTVSITVPSLPTPTVTTPIPAPTVPPATVPTVPTPPPVVLQPPAPRPPAAPPPPEVTVTVAPEPAAGRSPSPPRSSSPAPTGLGRSSSPVTGPSAGSAPAAETDEARRPRPAARPKKLEARIWRSRKRVGVRLVFPLPTAGRVFLIARGPAPSCRIAGHIPVRGRRGMNTIFFAGRVHGRRLPVGLYAISLSLNRRLVRGASAAYVRVVSGRRSLPSPNSASKPWCTAALTLSADPTARILVRESARSTARPAAPLRPPLQIPAAREEDDVDADAAGLLPNPGPVDPEEEVANPLATIAVLAVVGALLLGMLALVTRFLRGTWNP